MIDAAASQRCALARALALASLVALLLALLWQFATLPGVPVATRAVLWALVALPLLVFLPGMVRGQWKTYQWLCFVVLLYFMQLSTRLFAPQATFLHWTEIALVGILFTSSMLYARWRRRALALRPEGGDNNGN